MEKEKSMTKGLKKLLIASIIFGVLTLAIFIVFPFLAKDTGKPEYASFNEFSKFLLTNIPNLFVFKYANPNNFVYFGVCMGVYVMLLCWLIAVIAGVFVCDNRKTALLVISFPLGLVNCLLYILLASSSQNFYQVITGSGVYHGKIVLLILAIALLVVYAIFFIINIIFYFWAMARSFAYQKEEAKVEAKEEPLPEPAPVVEQPQEALIEEASKEEAKENHELKIILIRKKKVVEKKEEPLPEPEPVKEPEPEPEPLPEPIPEPVVMEEPKEEEIIDIPLREEEPEEEMMPLEEQPEDNENNEWNRNKRQPFITRIITADLDIKANYNEIKNELLSYGVKARLSRSGETFRLKDKKYAKIYLVGKTLKVYLALSPEDYKDSPIPVEDVGHRPNYAEMPLLFKVRSGLSVRRCKDLIKAAMEKDGLSKNEVEGVNWVNELRTVNAEKAKENKNK